MKLPTGYKFRCQDKDDSDKGCVISAGIMELPEGYDERATVIEWGVDTMIYLADGRNL